MDSQNFLSSLSDEERYRLLIEAITDYAIYLLDARGYVSSWNPGAERFKGYSAKEIIGEHFSRFYTEEDRVAGVPERALKTATEEGRYEAEGWRVRKDGTRFWTNVVIDPIRNENGSVVGFAKITRDWTERREAQKALESSREAMIQAQKMEAIGQLTGGIAHDFNNLLTVVISNLGLLRKRLSNDPVGLSLLDNAATGAKRGASLTQHMLSYARRQEIDVRPTDLAEVVHGMRHLLAQALDPSVGIQIKLPLHLPKVAVDPIQLESVLLNLAINARDAMPNGGEIKFTAQRENGRDAEFVSLSVDDEGTGMNPETLQRATEPFFTTKGPGKGTGLGLSMAQGLVQQWGGALSIRSKLGEGTSVILQLPLSSESEPAAEIVQPMEDPVTLRDSSLTILVVDDDMLVLMGTTAMLEDIGHIPVSAGSGQEALQILRSRSDIEMVITDHAMPGMTGLELAEHIHVEQPELPVILATGYAELPKGAQANLPRLGKPFFQKQLVQAIDNAMQRS